MPNQRESTTSNTASNVSNGASRRSSPQGRFWILTIPHADYQQPNTLPPNVTYIKGQLECGESGYFHWQLVACFGRKVRLGAVKSVFGCTAHAELTRSAAANQYVCKDETAIEPEVNRFELGYDENNQLIKLIRL